jgi:hypothetical protein
MDGTLDDLIEALENLRMHPDVPSDINSFRVRYLDLENMTQGEVSGLRVDNEMECVWLEVTAAE